MVHIFITMQNFSTTMVYIYALFVMLHVFAYTATLDGKKIALITELIKMGLGIILLFIQNFSWYGIGDNITIGLIFYFFISLLFTYYFLKEQELDQVTAHPI